MKTLLVATATLVLSAQAALCATWSADDVNTADPFEVEGDGPHPGIFRLQVLLDRAGASTGWIDGFQGPSTEMAIRAFEEMNGMTVDGMLDEAVWQALAADGAPAMQRYVLSEEDVGQQLVPDFDAGEWDTMRQLDCLCYHRLSEALAEKFHMDEQLLLDLNPDADFSRAGTEIVVAAPGGPRDIAVSRVFVDKAAGQARGYDQGGHLVWAARAAVGSQSTPSPSGRMEVTAVAVMPTYTFDPRNYPETTIQESFQVAAGPNGPVGSVWIDLSKPTYGIHGTPHPEKMNTMESHGCVRLTNWDATELAHLVGQGVVVEFQ